MYPANGKESSMKMQLARKGLASSGSETEIKTYPIRWYVNSDFSIEFYRPAAENGSSSRAITPVIATDAIAGAFAGRTFHTHCVEQNTRPTVVIPSRTVSFISRALKAIALNANSKTFNVKRIKVPIIVRARTVKDQRHNVTAVRLDSNPQNSRTG